MARLRRRGCRGASMRVATLSGCLSCGAHSCRIPGPLLRIRPLPPGANPPGGARQLQSPAIPSTWASDAQPTTRCCGGAGKPNYARPRRAVNGRRTKIFVRATADGGRVPAALRPGLRRNILSSSSRGNGCFASGEGCRRHTPGEGVQRRDGDRHSDIVWRNTTTGANTVWLSANIASPLRLTGPSSTRRGRWCPEPRPADPVGLCRRTSAHP